MKIQQFKTSPTLTSDDMESSVMGLDEKSMDMFGYFFRNKIYTDKILAVIRETICNAWDEHVKHSITEPVRVKLRQDGSDTYWSCRDYAKGLSDEDVRKVFGTYGASKKRESNNLIGGFGVGAASPLAYTDTFYVTSHFEGTMIKYAFMLGGGDQGVEVGKIYEVHKAPTTESGIEVELMLGQGDGYTFNNKTILFVSTFLPEANIEYDSEKGYDKITPIQPEYIENIGGKRVCFYKNESPFSTIRYCAARMGGVIYDNIAIDTKAGNKLHKIVVDFNIGDLTIPMSRESLETTPNNTRVLSEVGEAIINFYEEDTKTLKIPDVKNILETTKKINYGDEATTKFQSHNIRETFRDTYHFVNSAVKPLTFDHTLKPNVLFNNLIIYRIPDNTAKNSWIKRLEKFTKEALPDKSIQYIVANDDPISIGLLDLTGISFMDVRKMKLPRLEAAVKDPTAEVKYVVYINNSENYFTCNDLDEYVTEKFFKGIEIDDGWVDDVDNATLLHRRTVGLYKKYGKRNNFYTCNSTKMFKTLIEMGWLDVDSAEYQKKIAEFRKIEEEKRKIEEARYALQSIHPTPKQLSQLVVKNITKKPDNVNRLKNILKVIQDEDTFRGRVLKAACGGYAKHLTRQDLRLILNTKG
jgi:hypothetical protein